MYAFMYWTLSTIHIITYARLRLPQLRTWRTRERLAIFHLEEERCPTALDDPVGHDGNPITERIGLVHEMGRQEYGSSWPIAQQKVPQVVPGIRVQPRWRLIKD